MKNIKFLFLIFTLYSIQAEGQGASTDATTTPKLDIAVPDIPAFSSLGINPSNILRPSDIKEVSSMVSNFVGINNSIAIPKSFAAEIAPGLLAQQNFDMEKYANGDGSYRFWHRIRLSVATTTGDDTSSRKMALGLRITIFNHADYLSNGDFLKLTQLHTTNINKAKKAAKDSAINLITDGSIIQNTDKESIAKVGLKSAVGITNFFDNIDTYKKYSTNPDSIAVYQIMQRIFEFFEDKYKVKEWNSEDVTNSINNWKKTQWNARSLEFAFSPTFYSLNSSGVGAFASGYHFWGVYSNGFGSWGQLLIGLAGFSTRTSDTVKFKNTWSLSSRFYFGTNKAKGFLEIQGTSISSQMSNSGHLISKSEISTLGNAGLEIGIVDGIWLNFSAGLTQSNLDTKPQLVANTQFNFTLPQKFNLF